MKNIFTLLVVSLVFIGAGCFNKPVEGSWFLAFNLPENWTVTTSSSSSFYNSFDVEIDRSLNEIILQDNNDLIFLPEEGSSIPNSEDREVRTADFTMILISRLDESRLIPRSSEDLGKGFFKNQRCGGSDRPCQPFQGEFEYYLENTSGKYRFSIISDSPDYTKIERIIKSAKSVTVIE
jgi:hypothetical protein